MNTEKVVAKIERLQPLLDLSGFALKHPRCGEGKEVVAEAEYWLDELINDFMEDFDSVYDLDHTGTEFWDNMFVLGLQSDKDLMSDLQVCVDMRRILKQFKRRCVKQLPVLFGGVRRAKTKAKRKTRSKDSESNNRDASS